MNKPAPTSEASRTLTIQQAADEAGVSHWTVRNWIKAAVLPAYRFPGTGRARDIVRIPRKDFEAFLKGSREGGV